MDSYGRLLNGEEPGDTPPLDSLELAAGAGVRQLAALVSGREAMVLSGEMTVVRSAATVPGTQRKVWDQVSIPWSWLANHGTDDPADFLFVLLDEPGLGVRGNTIVDEPPTRIASSGRGRQPLGRGRAADARAPGLERTPPPGPAADALPGGGP